MSPTCFRDRHLKEWDLRLTLAKAIQIDRSDFTAYTKTPIIVTRFSQEAVAEILTDTALMFAVIGVIVRDQARSNLHIDPIENPTDEEKFQTAFADSIDGSCIDEARDALIEALGDFSRAAKTALSSFGMTLKKFNQKATSRLSEIQPLMEEKMNRELDKEIERLKTDLSEKSLQS